MGDKTEIKEFKRNIIIYCAVCLLFIGASSFCLYRLISGQNGNSDKAYDIFMCCCSLIFTLVMIASIIYSAVFIITYKKKSEMLISKAIEYEEQMLNYVKQRFEKYKEGLDNLGLDEDIELIWYNQQEKNSDMAFSRIDFKKGYTCCIDITIRKKEDPKYDIDLEAISFIHPVAMFGKSLLRHMLGLCSKYSKVPEKMLNEYLNNAKDTINEVFDKGYEVVLQEIKEKN